MARNKYHAKVTHVGETCFASKREAARYSELKLLERAGAITNLELQPKFKFSVDGRPVLITSKRYPNGRQASYKADFAYFDTKTNARVIEDVKSPASRTEAYCIRKALVEAMYPGTTIVEV